MSLLSSSADMDLGELVVAWSCVAGGSVLLLVGGPFPLVLI